MSWNEITDLVLQAQTGDRAAYGELVRRFEKAVFGMALARVHDPLEAQELAQEVFIHGMRKLPQLRDPRCFAGWLRRITARRHAEAPTPLPHRMTTRTKHDLHEGPTT